jgi:excisionase family DNA binding protein
MDARRPTDGVSITARSIMRLPPQKAAEYVGCCVGLIYKLCRSGRLVHYRLGRGRGKILLDTLDLDRFLDACKVGYVPPPAPKPKPVKLKHLHLT